MDDFTLRLAESVRDGECLLLVLSGKRRDSIEAADKVTLRPVVLKGTPQYQLALRIGTQETHENLAPRDAAERVGRLFPAAFEHAHLFATEADYEARMMRDGSIRVRRKPPSRVAKSAGTHDRTKQYLIPENVPNAFLAEIGVMTPDGKVRAQKTKKFRQINRFLELVNDVVADLAPSGPLHVVDFGCGKSSLTFAIHHLLTTVHGRDVQIIGLDRNPHVIAECTRIAGRLGCAGLEFRQGDIAQYDPPARVDLAVSLHACDTATDDAITKAIGWQADVILAVPCCQHELAAKMQSPPLALIEEHGILKERFAALATDALRAKMLEAHGYRTQVVEFIEMEHTPKNVLLRAVRRKERDERHERAAAEAFEQFKTLLGVDRLYLEGLFGERGP